MAILLANNANGYLASSITAAATSIPLQTGQGALFPNPTGGDFFPVTLVRADGQLEICYCTGRSGDVLTVTRARESTTAKTFSSGERVSLRLTNGVMQTIFDVVNPITPFAKTLLDDADAAAMRTTLELGAQTKVLTAAINDLNDTTLIPYQDRSVITSFTTSNPANKPANSGSYFMIQSIGLVTGAPNEVFYQKLFDVQKGYTFERLVSTANGGSSYTYTEFKLVSSSAIQLPTKGSFSLRNKIINGKMLIAQRGTSFTGLPAANSGARTLDMWNLSGAVSTAILTISQSSDAPPSLSAGYSLGVTVTTADASVTATKAVGINTKLEGHNIRDLLSTTFTLSFWVKSSKLGVHCVAFGNSIDRSYIAEFTVNAANTWEKKKVTVVGGIPSNGTWNFLNGMGMIISFMLMAGSNYQSTKDTWLTSTSPIATANQVNVLDTVGNVYAITGVQLEAGETDTEFEHRDVGVETMMCQRYLEIGSVGILFSAPRSGESIGYYQPFQVMKRATPTITLTQGYKVNASDVAAQFPSQGGMRVVCTTTAATSGETNATYVASAEL